MIGSFSIGSIGAGKLFSQEARDYFRRLELAPGGNARLTRYDRANAYLIDASKGEGSAYWDTMGTLVPMVACGFTGALIPIRDGMDVGTPVNFSSGNYNAVTGYIGNGSTMYIDSNRNNNTDGQNDQAMGVWVSTAATVTSAYMGTGAAGSTGAHHFGVDVGAGLAFHRNRRSAAGTTAGASTATGYFATSRALAASYDMRISGATATHTVDSQVPYDGNINVYRRINASPITTDARLAVYHIGPAITLATMDAILTEFMARVAAA